MTRTKSSATNLFFMVLVLLSLGHLAAQVSAAAPVSADNPLQLTPNHVTLSVADIEKEAAWYHDVLGFQPYQLAAKRTDIVLCSLGIPGVYRLDLVWQKGSVRHTTPGSGFKEQGYTHTVFKTAISLDRVNQQLTAKNATVVAEKDMNGVVTNIHVRDPEGNEIVIQH
jgi:catechol-2,3-dioxygenase